MDLSTRYLGLDLAHPFVPGASPLATDLDIVRRLEDAGAAAIVMHSLFEEQIVQEREGLRHDVGSHADSSAEAASYFPDATDYPLGPDRYLEQLARIKHRVDVPVIASLNGTTPEGWLQYARLLQQAGADALELNFYHVATHFYEDGASVERRVVDIVAALKESVKIPLAVKLSPFYSALPHLAWQLDRLGTDGLVLFNRFYQPDINPETLDTVPELQLSDSSELLLRLRWTAILWGRIKASLAITGGVHEPLDAVKAIMAGADCVQLVSTLLRHGPSALTRIKRGFEEWADLHEYDSVRQMRGSMGLSRCPNPEAFERGNYVKTLHSWHRPEPPAVSH